MSHLSREFIQFFKDLSNNNSKEWFNDNRIRYEKKVRNPFKHFVTEMINRINKYDEEVQIEAKDAISRINKDIRFSKDKTPYNTHLSANISAYGKKDKAYPGFYFQFSNSNILLVGGSYMLSASQIKNVRDLLVDNGDEFDRVLNEKAFKDKFGELKGEQSKRIPEEYREFAKNQSLITNKQFYYEAELPTNQLLKNDLIDTLMSYYLAGKPVIDFLKKAFN